jgi:hypothetical protein
MNGNKHGTSASWCSGGWCCLLLLHTRDRILLLLFFSLNSTSSTVEFVISLALIKLRVLRVISLDDINLAGPKLRGGVASDYSGFVRYDYSLRKKKEVGGAPATRNINTVCRPPPID